MMEDSESKVPPRTGSTLLAATGSPGGKTGPALSFELLFIGSRVPFRSAREGEKLGLEGCLKVS